MVIICVSAATDGPGQTLEQTIGASIGRRRVDLFGHRYRMWTDAKDKRMVATIATVDRRLDGLAAVAGLRGATASGGGTTGP